MFDDLEKGVFMVFAFDKKGSSFAQGSGFFISSSGIGITNYHVLEGYQKYAIKTTDGEVYPDTGFFRNE